MFHQDLKSFLFLTVFTVKSSVTLNHVLIETGKTMGTEDITRFNMTKDFGIEATGGQRLCEEMRANKGLLARLSQC